jgi:thioredoxin 1
VLTYSHWTRGKVLRRYASLATPVAYRSPFFFPHQDHCWSPMATLELNQSNFEQTILGNDIVIVDFWAPWCGPCRSFAPVFEAASDRYADIVFAKVNTEEEHALAGHFQIRSIPTLMVFREKVVLYAQPGALPASGLEDLIGKVRELDMAQVHQDIAAQEAKPS